MNLLRTINNKTKMKPVFKPIEYICNKGTFLPANTTTCQTCADNMTCIGGIYAFNEKNAQGVTHEKILTQDASKICSINMLHAINNKTRLTPVFTPKTIICPIGKYLTANSIGCDTNCPTNSYCPGGIYTFSETETQGILPCPETHPYAPVGMWAESQCGRKLYVDGEYLYLHKSPAAPAEHRLYARIDGKVYSANATPIIDNPDLKMSVNTQRALHVKIDGVEYLIHDDSVK